MMKTLMIMLVGVASVFVHGQGDTLVYALEALQEQTGKALKDFKKLQECGYKPRTSYNHDLQGGEWYKISKNKRMCGLAKNAHKLISYFHL